MEILHQLGANETAFIQFFIFAITIAILTIFIFGPYFKAFDLRQQKTKGAESVSKETIEEAKNLNLVFQSHAREQNDKIKKIFETQKAESEIVTEDILKSAKQSSEQTLLLARTNLNKEVSAAKNQLEDLSKEIATQLTQKLESGL
jgi:F0F1-type ATP synthase membrane subunit b/b'